MSLNDLFVQILQSEQKAKERKTLLNEVKNEIVKVQEQLKEVQEESISTQGHLVVKLQCQTDAELSFVWLRHKKSILTEQLANVTKERDASDYKLRSLEASQAKEHKNFIQEISTFNQTYDLCGGGREQREADARQRVRELKQQEQSLLEELSDYRESQSRRARLITEKKQLKEETESLQMTLTGLNKQLDQEKGLTKELDVVKDQITNLPQNDAEFIRLRSKLDACHSEGSRLEATCHALQQQVESLQRQRWQQQLQRQSNQAGAGSTGTVGRTQGRNDGHRKAEKRQAQPNTLHFTGQSEPVNTWSSFHVTHSLPTSHNATSPNNHQVCTPPTQLGTNHPPASSNATQSVRSLCGRVELLLPPRGDGKPNLAKLTRGNKSGETVKPSERPAPMSGNRQFNFRHTPACDPSQGIKQGSTLTSSSSRNETKIDGDRSEMQDSQMQGYAKKVRFKY